MSEADGRGVARRRTAGRARRGDRVLLTGMGGELGSLVAQLLEAEPWVERLVGMDLDPPRRRLRRAEFHLVDPHDRRRAAGLVREVQPTVIVHAGVYEPGARANSGGAAHRTADAASAVFGQLGALDALRAVVVRSGIEVYGRRTTGAASAPDESAAVSPTSLFGSMLADVEARAVAAAGALGVAVARVRLAPVIGPHVPSPLGRLLRLPLVPVDLLRSAEFSAVHLDDAARALVAAARDGVDGAVNVVGAGSLSPWRAVQLGRRVPVPVIGPGWGAARRAAYLAGAPLPEHVHELLTCGRTADGRLADPLGLAPTRSTEQAVRALYAWESVTHVRPTGPAATPYPATAAAPAAAHDGTDRSRLRVVS